MEFDKNYIKNRHFGVYGGRYVPEMLIPTLDEIENAYTKLKNDLKFKHELKEIYKNFVGRPTPLLFAENLTRQLKGPKIYLKLEGHTHTGAHKINNAVGQALLARHLGKTRIIAETGAGQHGLATATVCAKLGLQCEIFMGETDYRRQRPNVFWMEMLGAKVTIVTDGTKTLKDAVNAAMKDWAATFRTTHYLIGSALGPYPFPLIVRDFQSIIGREVRDQIMEKEGRLPDTLVACTGGGSNSLGLFHPFLGDEQVKMIGVEAGGTGIDKKHAARFQGGKVGIVQSYKSYFLQDDDGQIAETHSISAGLDYAGVGPELAHLHDVKRINFRFATDDEALDAVKTLARAEGIIPALESAHAVAYVIKHARSLADELVVINVSGRGDKDIFILTKALGDKNWKEFLRDEIERY
ncbi:MAG: tryptophan synthase subunit beta [Spirochaetes bacterium]|nr:tryptophan synthase subunit beta [Spirochaetota bacterium]